MKRVIAIAMIRQVFRRYLMDGLIVHVAFKSTVDKVLNT